MVRTLSEICRDIRKDWTNMNYAAVPYFQAMQSMETVHSPYYEDSGSSVVNYFLCNASTWRGPVAKAIKNELKQALKTKP